LSRYEGEGAGHPGSRARYVPDVAANG
jgi:hypothetical protein